MQIGVQVSGLIEQFMASFHNIYHAVVQFSMYQTGRTGSIHVASAFYSTVSGLQYHTLCMEYESKALSPTATTNRSGSIASYNTTLA